MCRGQETTKELVSIEGEMRFFSGRWREDKNIVEKGAGGTEQGETAGAECVWWGENPGKPGVDNVVKKYATLSSN